MLRIAPALLACSLWTVPLPGWPQASTEPSLVFDKIEAMVPVRDGVRLQTEIYVPKGAGEKLPFLLMRTPYGFDTDPKGFSRWLARPWLRDLLRDGYLVVLQSVRGRFKSEGTFVIEPPLRDRNDAKSTDEGTDTYDTVEWLLAHVPSNGRVGLIGVSNPGRLVAMAMVEPHPAVRAYSPQATPADNFLGDDFFHGGAFRLPLLEFVYAMESSREFTEPPLDRADLYDWYRALGPLSRVNPTLMQGKRPTWNDFVAHPTYDRYWQSHSLPLQLKSVPAPTLHVGGAFDQEDRRGPVALYSALERTDAKGQNFLVVGPWAHRTWRFEEGDHLGRLEFGSATARTFREEVQAPFFACHLKDKCGPALPEALVFQTGRNVWQRLAAWPPKEVKPRTLWLREGGALSFEPPARDGDAQADAFLSDPASPVPSQPRPIVASFVDRELHDQGWATSLVADQRFVEGRPDVLTWESAPLAQEVVVAGSIAAHLFVSTTGTDADFVAKLIDVWPEPPHQGTAQGAAFGQSIRREQVPQVPIDPTMGGYQAMVAGEILRGRFRKSFEKPEPFAPGKVEEVSIDLLTRSHVFLKGHRILVEVHSTWFPLYDRNPQTFVPNIFEARESDFRAQTHRVHRSRRFASHVTFDSVPP
jgi:hypothetical protein